MLATRTRSILVLLLKWTSFGILGLHGCAETLVSRNRECTAPGGQQDYEPTIEFREKCVRTRAGLWLIIGPRSAPEAISMPAPGQTRCLRHTYACLICTCILSTAALGQANLGLPPPSR